MQCPPFEKPCVRSEIFLRQPIRPTVVIGGHRRPLVTDRYHILPWLVPWVTIGTDRFQWPPMFVADGKSPNARYLHTTLFLGKTTMKLNDYKHLIQYSEHSFNIRYGDVGGQAATRMLFRPRMVYNKVYITHFLSFVIHRKNNHLLQTKTGPDCNNYNIDKWLQRWRRYQYRRSTYLFILRHLQENYHFVQTESGWDYDINNNSDNRIQLWGFAYTYRRNNGVGRRRTKQNNAVMETLHTYGRREVFIRAGTTFVLLKVQT